MKFHRCARRVLLAAGLVSISLSVASAQDLYKSRTEMLQAEAANKAANAAIITAMAGYEKSQAEIAKLMQEVREKGAQNDLLEAEIYYKKRAQHQAAKRAEVPVPVAPAETAKQITREASARLSGRSAAPVAGKLSWPTLLKASAYSASRTQIDCLLCDRTPEDSGVGSQNCVEVMASLETLKKDLRKNISRYSFNDYLAARKFLDAVAREAQEPIGVPETLDRVAGN